MNQLPDLTELLALRAQVQGLSLQSPAQTLSRRQGSYRSSQRGRGLEFEEVRPYAEGDDVRAMDWRVTARRGKPHIKLFREERERAVWLVIHLHPGLYFGSRRQLKSSLALRAAALLGWIAMQGGDRLGACLCCEADHPWISPPRGREAGLLPILQAMVDHQPRSPGEPLMAGLVNAVRQINSLAHTGSLVYILSDFFHVDETLTHALALLAGHVECRLLSLEDPLERQGLPHGSFQLGIPGQLRWMQGDSSRQAWQHAWSTRDNQLKNLSQSLRLSCKSLSTDAPLKHTLSLMLRPFP
ncbi:MAG: DUF58 domain-containing protein [Pseudomonadales bacterium]|nr:DUF58 domain-containing protein [Pseudomonadales bacterium]